MITLITGGSGCGKSVWAEKTIHAISPEQKYYLATMQYMDPETGMRIERHRRQRAGMNFETIECPTDIGSIHLPEHTTVLLEDIPNLLANEMFGGGNWTRILPGFLRLSERCSHFFVVTNDVFSDGDTYSDETRQYMHHLAEINRSLAAIADHVVEVVYSIPVFLKGNSLALCDGLSKKTSAVDTMPKA